MKIEHVFLIIGLASPYVMLYFSRVGEGMKERISNLLTNSNENKANIANILERLIKVEQIIEEKVELADVRSKDVESRLRDLEKVKRR